MRKAIGECYLRIGSHRTWSFRPACTRGSRDADSQFSLVPGYEGKSQFSSDSDVCFTPPLLGFSCIITFDLGCDDRKRIFVV